MGPLLSSLVSLQSIETELRKKQQRLRQTQQVVRRQEQQIQRLTEAVAAKHEEIKLTRLQHDRLELELKSGDEDIAKLRLALNQARTNKDYSAILTRINTEKADKSKLEDQILSLLSQIDADRIACKEIEESVAQEEGRLATIRAEAAEKQAGLDKEIVGLLSRRNDAAANVPSKELSLFERLADRYNGEVLAEVSQLNGKRSDHTCGGCYMSVTLESVNSLMTRDEVVTCPSCGRILVLDKKLMQEPTH